MPGTPLRCATRPRTIFVLFGGLPGGPLLVFAPGTNLAMFAPGASLRLFAARTALPFVAFVVVTRGDSL